MALVMGAIMAVIMLGFMWNMYTNWRVNTGIFIGSTIIFILAFRLVRSQETIEDVSWLKAMIPHHSIAILTSERARYLRSACVRELADAIIETQRKEIAEMKVLIQDLEHQ